MKDGESPFKDILVTLTAETFERIIGVYSAEFQARFRREAGLHSPDYFRTQQEVRAQVLEERKNNIETAKMTFLQFHGQQVWVVYSENIIQLSQLIRRRGPTILAESLAPLQTMEGLALEGTGVAPNHPVYGRLHDGVHVRRYVEPEMIHPRSFCEKVLPPALKVQQEPVYYRVGHGLDRKKQPAE